MMRLTRLPKSVSQYLRVLGPCFHNRHHLVFSWLLLLHMIYGREANLKALARKGPEHVAYWHYRRLLCAAYWCSKVLVWWFADQAIQAFPPPENGVLYMIGDSTHKEKQGKKHPVARKMRLSRSHPFIFGFRIVFLMAHWDVYRIPVDFELIRHKDDPNYRRENALFRQMLQRFRPPTWAKAVIVVADAAYASRANLILITQLGYWYVFAVARTWKFADGKMLKDLVTHLPRQYYQQTWVPAINGQRRRTFWVYSKRVELRHLGEVTIVLFKFRRNDGPKKVNIVVTNLPEEIAARQIVAIYLRRWSVELLFKELKGAMGLGQHQVTKKVDRVERSVAISVMAYLMLITLRAKEIPSGRPWSAFALQQAFASEVAEEQFERSVLQTARKWLRMGKVA